MGLFSRIVATSNGTRGVACMGFVGAALISWVLLAHVAAPHSPISTSNALWRPIGSVQAGRPTTGSGRGWMRGRLNEDGHPRTRTAIQVKAVPPSASSAGPPAVEGMAVQHLLGMEQPPPALVGVAATQPSPALAWALALAVLMSAGALSYWAWAERHRRLQKPGLPLLEMSRGARTGAEHVGRREALAAASLALGTQLPLPAAAQGPAPKITDRVYFKVQIARKDGSLDPRDDAPDQPYFATLVFGLYGEAAPKSVQKFLTFAQSYRPGFANADFFRLQKGALLEGGRIPGLRVTELQGKTTLQYTPMGLMGVAATKDPNRGFDIEILGPELAQLAVDFNDLSHNRRGLLTHSKLEALPEFGITLAPCRQLDETNVIFGELLEGEEFLQCVEVLPVIKELKGALGGLVTSQKNGYRKIAPALGDKRKDVVFANKIVRRVDVKESGVLKD